MENMTNETNLAYVALEGEKDKFGAAKDETAWTLGYSTEHFLVLTFLMFNGLEIQWLSLIKNELIKVKYPYLTAVALEDTLVVLWTFS
jgi:hypothetical protein